jgi:hypothetical protein
MHKYPHTSLLLASFIAAYISFQLGWFDWIATLASGYGYVSVFVAGILFSCGFTTPFAIGIFVELAHVVHPLPAAILGGIGALCADSLLFQFVRSSVLHDELNRLKVTPFFLRIKILFEHPRLTDRFRTYLLWSFAGIIIASPFPDELGVVLLSGATQMNKRTFAVLCLCLNTFGILLILLSARAAGF